ncbi:hypothetical protein GCM10009530_71900 [Microbispora corallina]|uniref:Uncharacterized protein n=1 Tax=Microbispora corallina TaxID=83302 RepID=A0ABQ4G0V0_9ACTN|nr:hypothetical protein Mco01_36990 [Microbispora corallina]
MTTRKVPSATATIAIQFLRGTRSGVGTGAGTDSTCVMGIAPLLSGLGIAFLTAVSRARAADASATDVRFEFRARSTRIPKNRGRALFFQGGSGVAAGARAFVSEKYGYALYRPALQWGALGVVRKCARREF